MLDDGVYDAFIVWAEEVEGAVSIEATITSGPSKGEVVALRAPGPGRGPGPLDLVGLACRLVVAGGHPSLSL